MAYRSICRDCDDGPSLRGLTMTNGRMPVTYCRKCGTIIEGTPSLFHRLYRWIYGSWPWEKT